jgi:hypothetical protein
MLACARSPRGDYLMRRGMSERVGIGKERKGEGRGDGGDTKVESWLAYGT